MLTRAQITDTFAMVFGRPGYVLLAGAGAALCLLVYLLVPLMAVPGNTVDLQFSGMELVDWTLLILLATITGVLVALEVFAFRRSHVYGGIATGRGSVGLAASLAAGVLTAASCGCGIGVLLAAVGLGGSALFIATHQTAFVAAMLAVVLVGLYFTLRRAAGVCATCHV